MAGLRGDVFVGGGAPTAKCVAAEISAPTMVVKMTIRIISLLFFPWEKA
jgi:hypothetical protein